VTRAFLIDLYDTLVWSDWDRWRDELSRDAGISVDALDRAFAETRAARNTGAYQDLEGSTRAIIIAAGLPDDPGMLHRWLEMDVRFMREGIELHDDALPTVRALRERGDATVLVSNCGPDTRLLVERLGLEAEFDALILSFEVGVRKPDPAIYEEALSAVGARPSDALFVDDQVDYCDGARAVGIETRLIIRPSERPAEGFAASTDGHAVIHDLTALLSWRDGAHGLRVLEP
jgi:HAD superfamily hydrolase (TIGR01509 family)